MQAAVNGWQQTESSALSLENFSMAEETNYDLNVVIVPGEEFYVKFSYNAGIYDREDMKRIKGHILEVISCVTEDPDRLLSSISLVPPEEEALIHSFNETNRPYPETTVHGLFEEQAAKTPDQEALRYNGEAGATKIKSAGESDCPCVKGKRRPFRSDHRCYAAPINEYSCCSARNLEVGQRLYAD